MHTFSLHALSKLLLVASSLWRIVCWEIPSRKKKKKKKLTFQPRWDLCEVYLSCFAMQWIPVFNTSIKTFDNAWWDRRSRKMSTNSRISAITEYSFQLRVCLHFIFCCIFPQEDFLYAFHTGQQFYKLVSQSIFWLVMSFAKKMQKNFKFQDGCLLVKCFKSLIIRFWFLR